MRQATALEATIASAAGSGEGCNLDWAAATADGVAVVLDGLSEIRDPDGGGPACRHGTAWYVRHLGVRLLGYAADPGRPLAEALATAIAEVAGAHGGGCSPGAPAAPGATVGLLRLSGDTAEYLVLSDSVVVLDTGDEPTVVTDRSVAGHLPDLVAAAAAETGRHDGTALAALIREQQRLRNTPDGYWVAQADPAAAGYALTGTVTGVRGALLLTDGAALLVTDFAAATWRELLDLGYTAGPTAIIAATRELERRDPTGTLWPRYKPHDDATAVVYRPTPTA